MNLGIFSPYYVPLWSSYYEILGGVLRDTSHAIVKWADKLYGQRPKEVLYRLRRVVPMDGHRADIRDHCFIAPSAVVIGNVLVHRKSTIGYNAIVRCDTHGSQTVIGESSCVFDKSVLASGVKLGKWVTIEPMCVLQENVVVDSCSYIGAGSMLLENSRVESGACLGVGSILTKGAVVPSGEVWSGNPAEKVGLLSEEDKRQLIQAAKYMVLMGLEHQMSATHAWEEHENHRLAREYHAHWASQYQQMRIRPFYVRDGPSMKVHRHGHTENTPQRMVQGQYYMYEDIAPGSFHPDNT